MTPIGARLVVMLSDERQRMANEWFCKWHYISGSMPVEIESFNGRLIRYGGIRYTGVPQTIYRQTIQHYLAKKICEVFYGIEDEILRYPFAIRVQALSEAKSFITDFAQQIRHEAVEKDRILQGDGFKFPQRQDIGEWVGSQPQDIAARVDQLRRIYCDVMSEVGGNNMVFGSMTKDKVTLVKHSGEVIRKDIPASVSSHQITMFVADLPIEVGDHFLRELPSKLVEDFIVVDPGYHSGVASIPPHFQTKVRRSDAPVATPQTVIATFHGANSRLNINSADNSFNVASDITPAQVKDLVAQIRAAAPGLPEAQRSGIESSLAELESEVNSATPSASKLRATLVSLRSVVEGASGNLVAAGIGSLISKLLGG
ncbi:hypothetical protein HNW77_03650 [Komagataeibacter sp. AV436]|uniref:AbiTii domain-containing protein n=1 Tax=Komagataeibacter melomenusus TaxID=2766578 RepID=A0ABX2AAY6_9PROT|nr:hypothetical protein [Komagataeibacter melomenusus]MBV1831993.1 hypothetical protein [Komagataeibacter melomenusus]NPC65513.1 hypothetical protein [Komagataeibacter melomenusus]